MSPLAQRLRGWLGRGGHKFFTELYDQFGEDFGTAVLSKPSALVNGALIPHPVHLREGMAVRNWLRDQKECRDWDAHRLDNEWAKLVLEAVRPPTRSIFERLKGKG